MVPCGQKWTEFGIWETETPESLEKRIGKVKKEMAFENSFDIVLVNNVLDITLKEAEHIVETFIYGVPK